MIKILLLDCSPEIEIKLKSKGFDVTSGTTGITSGIRNIPVAFYEQNIIIFDPRPSKYLTQSSVNTRNNGTLSILGIIDGTPEVQNKDIKDFLKNGGIILSFANPLDVEANPPSAHKELAVFSWIPSFPVLVQTKDREIVKSTNLINVERDIAFLSIFRDFQVKIPVLRRLKNCDDAIYPRDLLLNARGDAISSYYDVDYRLENGRVIVLPQFDSNDDVIEHFVNYVYPQLFEISPDLPKELKIKQSQRLEKLQEQLEKAESFEKKVVLDLQRLRSEIVEENLRIEKLMDGDQTARLIIGYLEDITESRQASWGLSYKIVQRLYHEFDTDKRAKEILNAAEEINFIKRITNDSERDTRHPPRLNDTINPPSEEELARIINDSKSLVEKYINYLISKDDEIVSSDSKND